MATALPPQSFQPGVAAVPATQVEISVSCRNLKDKDTFSKSDPMCVLFTKEFAQDSYLEFGRTEQIKDTVNPEFVRKFVINYYFEQAQKLMFQLYDVDSGSARLDAHDFLGSAECTLGEVVGSPNNCITKPLGGVSGKAGTICIRAEEVQASKETFTLELRGHKLDKKDFMGKSDSFLVFSRSNEDGSFTVVHRTEVVRKSLNPTWQPFTLSARVLANGDLDRVIKVDCYDWDSDGGSHDFIGSFTTTLKELSRGPGSGNTYELINAKKQAKKKSYKNSGTVSLVNCRVALEHSFLDFIAGGLQLNFTVAVDFTASNGDPTSPTSLHYINNYAPNQYALALQSVGGIIQDYDTDKQFPAMGFGARLPPDGRVSHEFPLNGDPSNPYCAGIAGVLDAYHRTLRAVQLYGPTNFSPVINHVSRFASAYRDGSHYFVLLIITDGVITDMPQTVAAVIAASSLPMSIIIVGVGDADFSAMETLDADDKRLIQDGRVAERDIVQFVPLREFLVGARGASVQASQAHLAREVLAEIPAQVTQYMSKHGVTPKPAPQQQQQQQQQQQPTVGPAGGAMW